MTQDLKTADGALVLQRNDLALVGGGQRVAQALQTRLTTLVGTRPWDASYGVDLLEVVFQRNPDLQAVAALLKTAILDVDGVESLTSYSQTLTGRSFSVTFKAQLTSDDDDELQVELAASQGSREKLTFVAHLV